MAPNSPHASLPSKPSSSLRKSLHRMRSLSPSSIDSSAQATPNRQGTPTTDTGSDSSTKKGRYERPVLLAKALASVKAETPRPATSATPATPASSRAQFEQQEDFISFDASPPPPAPKFIPKKQRDSAPPSKRKLDEFEERTEEKNERVQRRERERTTPWCVDPGVDWASCKSATAMLNAEARSFITYISPTPIEHELRTWTIELIRRTIQQRWPEADVQCFGSVSTGLYLPGGDIDLVVLCPLFPSPPLKPTSSLLHSLASLLLTSSLAEPSSLLVIAKARVPIVKFQTRYGGFAVDLSVNQAGGVDAAMKVRKLLEDHAHRDEGYVEPGQGELDAPGFVDYGVARSLVMLVKAFLNQRGMNEVFTGGLGSYSIICLVVSFLQLHPKIQTGAIHPARNIGLLFAEFLEYYGKHFNFDEAGITLRGRGGYFNKHDKGWFRPNQPYLLSIEDPNDPLNDVSGGSHNILRVRQTLAGAFDVLAATLLHRVSHFASTPNPLSSESLPNSDYASASNPLSQSILGSIIGMSKLGIKSRLANITLFEEGILQSLLVDKEKTSGSKKAVKKLWKEEKESKKSKRTMARLELRMKEREEKVARKAAKKLALLETLAPMAVVAGTSISTTFDLDNEEDKDDDDLPRTLFTTATTSTTVGEPSDSRYSITTTSATTSEVIYIGSDSSASDDEDSDEDDDVIMGGTGGILGRSPPSKTRGVEEPEEKKRRKEEKASFWSAKGSKEP